MLSPHHLAITTQEYKDFPKNRCITEYIRACDHSLHKHNKNARNEDTKLMNEYKVSEPTYLKCSNPL